MSDGKTPVGNETCTLGGFWRLILCMPPEEGTNTGDATERVYRPPATKGNRGDASNSNPLIDTKTATVNDEYSDADNDEEEMTKSEKRRWKAELRAQQEEEKRREERLAELKEVLNNNAILKGREVRLVFFLCGVSTDSLCDTHCYNSSPSSPSSPLLFSMPKLLIILPYYLKMTPHPLNELKST